jgi:serine/threonine-protein kinase HipA
MANLLWGQVYFKETLAGYIRQETGNRISFTYDEDYLNSGQPAIAHTLPFQTKPLIDPMGLPPFFDNLVAEGWLENAQKRLLGKRSASRFELLLAYGYDCAGAVSIVDPDPHPKSSALMNLSNPAEAALITSHASLSGVQAKLAIIEKKGLYFPTASNELSTHIAKLPSPQHADIIENEYLSMLAFQTLSPNDKVATIHIGCIEGFSQPALIVKRFDRQNGQRIHFEEFNQLLGLTSHMKYERDYKHMAEFMLQHTQCLPTEIYYLFLRIAAGLLIGNTDMHLKNFALFNTGNELRLTPSYDQVAATFYNYKTMALSMSGSANLPIEKVTYRHIINLGKAYNLSNSTIRMAVKQLENNIGQAKQIITESPVGNDHLKNQLIKLMEKTWNTTFALIGKALSTKP